MVREAATTCMCVRVLVASIVQNVECIIDGASKREQNPTGSE